MYFFNIANSIDAMHKLGFTHCDITGSNLLINEDFNIKIIDFDFAIIMNKDNYERRIDILKYTSLVFEFIFEQLYLHDSYGFYPNVDMKEKRECFQKAAPHKIFNSCLDVYYHIFGSPS